MVERMPKAEFYALLYVNDLSKAVSKYDLDRKIIKLTQRKSYFFRKLYKVFKENRRVFKDNTRWKLLYKLFRELNREKRTCKLIQGIQALVKEEHYLTFLGLIISNSRTRSSFDHSSHRLLYDENPSSSRIRYNNQEQERLLKKFEI